MKKNKITTLTILVLLIILPILGFFTIGGVADSPSYVGIYEEDYYEWDINCYYEALEWAQWDADNMSDTLTFLYSHDILSNLTLVYTHWAWGTPPQAFWPLTVDAILPETTSQLLLASGIDDMINHTPMNGTFGSDWGMDSNINPYYADIVCNTSSFAKQSLYGGMATTPYWIMGVLFAPTNINWPDFVTECQAEMETYWGSGVENTTIAAQADGYLMTVPIGGYISNTQVIKITVTYNSDGILTYWSLEYGSVMLLDYVLTKAISGTLTITSPTSSDTWYGGASNNITWTSTGEISDVKLDLYLSDVFVMEINSSTPNDGHFVWVTPDTLADSTEYQIKITNVAEPTTYGFSEYFEIYTEVDHITIVTPDSSTAWEINTTNTITWKSPIGFVTKVIIELYLNDTLKMILDDNTNDADGEFEWTVPSNFNASSLYQIKIIDKQNTSEYDFSDYFEIYQPSINVTSPDSSSSWAIGSGKGITWTTRGTVIDNVKIDLYLNSDKILTLTSNTTNIGIYLWTVPKTLTNSTQYQVKITDVANSSYYDYSDNFEIFTPTITVTYPISTTSWEAGTSSNSITWTSNGASSSIQIELYLSGVFVVYVAGVTLNDGEFEWQIPSNLTASSEYQVKILDYNDPDTFVLSDNFEITAATLPGGGGAAPTDPVIISLIVIGVVAGAGVAAAGGYIFLKKKRIAGGPSSIE
ncbi:MAG: hypothetical protein KGD65_11520 [Candidatus Lokiarchaeota archaeon]|nr:hypothetical protein [Candidatus Lokiarchaeota archaeon]